VTRMKAAIAVASPRLATPRPAPST
jgi:hypothetical protein